MSKQRLDPPPPGTPLSNANEQQATDPKEKKAGKNERTAPKEQSNSNNASQGAEQMTVNSDEQKRVTNTAGCDTEDYPESDVDPSARR